MVARHQANRVTLQSGKQITVYASPRIHEALRDGSGALNLYKGVRLARVIEAVCVQGKKDSAREAFDAQYKALTQAEKQIPHRPPGRPRHFRQ